METLAYLHLIEDFQNPENEASNFKSNFNWSKTAGKAAIGVTGVACTVSVLGATNAAFACSYHSEHYSPDYYSYQSDSYQPDSYQPDSYQPDSYQPDSYQSCGCEGSQQSYYPDYSQNYSQEYSYDYSHDYSHYAPSGYNGVSEPFVADLQAALANQGYYGGPIDGVYGPGTFQAVTQYQIDRGLAVDGVAGGQTLDSLGLGGYGA